MAHEAAEVALRCQRAQEDGHLDLSNCELTKFPDALFILMKNTEVQSLNLNKNILKVLSPKIPQNWKKLQELQINENQLFSLPPDMEQMENLKKLRIAHNDFNHIPTVVYNLPLEILIANNNHIEQVAAEELKSKTLLKYVDLRENPLSDTLKSQLMEREDWDLLI